MDKHRKLVELLFSKTKEGSLDWKDTPIDDVYQVSFSSSGILIRLSGETSQDITISITNSEGHVVDSFTDVDIDEDTAGRYYRMMQEIYRIAQRVALGSEKILDDVLDQLERPNRR